jgi:hypothetical protein
LKLMGPLARKKGRTEQDLRVGGEALLCLRALLPLGVAVGALAAQRHATARIAHGLAHPEGGVRIAALDALATLALSSDEGLEAVIDVRGGGVFLFTSPPPPSEPLTCAGAGKT